MAVGGVLQASVRALKPQHPVTATATRRSPADSRRPYRRTPPPRHPLLDRQHLLGTLLLISPVPELWPHQREAVAATVGELTTSERVTLPMACGTGKTRIAGEVARLIVDPATGRVLFVAPLLELLAQTLREWRRVFGDDVLGRITAVCSDPEVVADHQPELEVERAIITSDPAVLARLLGSAGRATVACTYQSLGVITAAHRDHGLAPFDLAIADEAHRTAGLADRQWTAFHDNARIAARRRLYLTATRKIVTAGGDHTVSMDDTKVYGNAAFKLSFSRGRELGLLAGYQTLVSVVTDQQIRSAASTIRSRPEFLQVGDSALAPSMLATQIAVLRAARDHGIRKMLTFHNRVADARWFATTLPLTASLLAEGDRPAQVRADHVHGGQTLAQRRRVLSLLHADDDAFTLVSNARVLGEGIDAPAVDSVAFIDPRHSAIDTVQAVGRALRRGNHQGPKTAYILVPVHLGPGETPETALDSSAYASVWQVLRSLSAHDEEFAARLADLRRRLGSLNGRPLPSCNQLPDWLHISGVPVPPGFADAITVRAVRSSTETWEEFLGACAAYKAEHGNLLVPHLHVTANGFPLGHRMNYERKLYKDGTQPPARQAALEELGVVWDALDHQRQRVLDELRAFKTAHGHLSVPKDYITPGDYPFDLYRAACWLRARHAEGLLDADHVKALNDLGMVWENRRDATWSRFLADLDVYQRAHGHLDVPQSYQTPDPCPRALGQQVASARRRKITGTLSPQALRDLEAIGFIWNADKHRYQLYVRALEVFKAAHGHANPASDYVTPPPDSVPLGGWLSRQRGKARIGKLPADYVRQLTRLGVRLPATGPAKQ
ncbi:Helicase associated domain protein [Streptomyces griseoviridis]|uniref:DEAD/DEAH box helicase n=1 Tax=Streptomyces griseoviridis TaxID=45398 RepID=UPI00344CF768